MKIGVKTFDSEEFLKYFEDKVDFFEIMTAQKNDYSFLRKFSLPIVIHAEHWGFKTNPADTTKKEENLKSLNFARKIADETNAKKIIVHPGILEYGDKNCSLENAIDFFRKIDDDRILIENLPLYHDNYKNLCATPEEVYSFMKETEIRKFCFDVNHHVQCLTEINNYDFIKKYLELNPIHYHIGGQRIKEKIGHTSFDNSELNLKRILRYYPRDAEITLETQTDIESVNKDVTTIKRILEKMKNPYSIFD
jgi:endonuclease IV